MLLNLSRFREKTSGNRKKTEKKGVSSCCCALLLTKDPLKKERCFFAKKAEAHLTIC